MSQMPYVGLRPFNEDEHDIFFGRNDQANELLEKIGQQYFTAVIGLSGSGKSSLIRAGVIPKAQMGLLAEAGEVWRIITMCPGNQPFKNLAEALLDEREDYGIKTEYKTLFENPDSKSFEEIKAFLDGNLYTSRNLQETLQGLKIPKETNFLLIVDQFEEIFRFREYFYRQHEVSKFVNFLLETSRAQSCVYIIITMRSDFIGECAQFEGLAEQINNGLFLVPRMTREKLREAIEKPIRVYNGSIDSALVGRILSDADHEPHQLPLIQYILKGMWYKTRLLDKNFEGNGEPPKYGIQINAQLYDKWEGLKKYLSKNLEKSYRELTQEEKQEEQKIVLEYLFRNLVEVNECLPNTRRAAKLDTVAQLVWHIMSQRFGHHIQEPDVFKLLTEAIDFFRDPKRGFLEPQWGISLKRETMVIVAHESIIMQWQRLQDWKQEEQKWANLYCSLEEDVKRWEAGRKNDKDLLRGSKLVLANEWLDLEHPSVVWASRYSKQAGIFLPKILEFIEVSSDNFKREEKEKEEQLQKQIQATLKEKVLAQREKRLAKQEIERVHREEELAKQKVALKKKTFNAYFMGATALIPMFIAMIFVYIQLLDTQGKRILDLFNSRINQAIVQIKDQQFDAARQTLRDNSLLLDETKDSVTPIPQQRQQAQRLLQQQVNLFSQTRPYQNFPQFESEIYSALWVEDRLILGGKKGKWGALKQSEFVSYPKLAGDVNAIAFYHRANWLITGDGSGQITIWDKNVQRIGGDTQKLEHEITALVVADNQLIAGDSHGTLHFWQITEQGLQNHRTEPYPSETPTRLSRGGLALSPDNNLLLTAFYTPIVKLWERIADNYQFKLGLGLGESKKVYQAKWSHDGQTIATAQANNDLRLYNLDGKLLRQFSGHRNAVFAVQFTDDNRYLISGSQDNRIRIWDVESAQTLQVLENHSGTITNLLIKDNKLWSTSLDGSVKQWSLSPPYQLVETCIEKHCPAFKVASDNFEYRKHPISASISPQADYVVVGFLDGSLRLYRLPEMTLIEETQAHRDRIRHVNFSSQETIFATASYDGTVKIWQIKDGKLHDLQKNFAVGAKVYDAAISPNNQMIATASLDGAVKLYQLNDPNIPPKELLPPEADKAALFVKFTDGTHLLATQNDRAYLIDIRNGTPQPIETAKENNYILGIAHAEGHFATYGQESKLTVYDRQYKQTFATPAHTNTIYDAIFSPSGQQIATLGSDHQLKMWDLDATRNNLLFTINLPVTGDTVVPSENLASAYDFDFRCAPTTGCWIVVPLTQGRIAVYPFGRIYD